MKCDIPKCFVEKTDCVMFEAASHIFIMQYTGRKDKSGKEIYEGDILWTYPLEQCEKGYGGEVKYGSYKLTRYDLPEDDGDEIMIKTNLFGFHTTNNTFNDEFHAEWENKYVIGNVYENPELIKKTEKCEK
jgi:uncharacterized phage protein (TIGR01671 family)